LTVTDPAASVALGVLAFQEKLDSNPGALALQVIGFVVMSLAAAQLARREAEGQDRPVAVVPPL
jgi:hypothetical protein